MWVYSIEILSIYGHITIEEEKTKKKKFLPTHIWFLGEGGINLEQQQKSSKSFRINNCIFNNKCSIINFNFFLIVKAMNRNWGMMMMMMIIELKLIHQLPQNLLRLLAVGCVEIFFVLRSLLFGLSFSVCAFFGHRNYSAW